MRIAFDMEIDREKLTGNKPQKTKSVMKKNKTYRMAAAFMLLLLVSSASCLAQKKVNDKEIIGVWILSSMKYEGENTNYVSDSYNQVKVYRANGEYACTEIYKLNDGSYFIKGGHYGTYVFKDGKYIEMGRDASGQMVLLDKVTCEGHYFNRIDIWKKVVDMPEKLTQHIVDKCKANQKDPEDIQKMTKRYIFNKK